MALALVTGSNGFIGSHLVEHLLKRGYQVRCLVRKTSDLKWLQGLDVDFVYGELSEPDSLIPAASNAEYVFHLAGKTKAPSKQAYFEANVKGTENLIHAVIEHAPHIKRFVYVSSQAAAGPSTNEDPVCESDPPRPVSWYGESKLEGENVVLSQSHKIPVTVIRPPVVYGPRDVDVLEIFQIIRKGIQPVLGWKARYGSFIYVDDLVRGILHAAEHKKTIGGTYFLVSESKISWDAFGAIISDVLQKKTITVHIPLFLFAAVALIRHIISKITGNVSILNLQKIREFRERFWICDGSKAKDEWDFNIEFPLEKGVRETVAWYQEMGWLS